MSDDVEKLIERLDNAPVKWMRDYDTSWVCTLFGDAAAMLRSLAAEKAKVEEELDDWIQKCQANFIQNGELRAKLERAREGLKEIQETTDGRDEVSFFTINTRARATLEELHD